MIATRSLAAEWQLVFLSALTPALLVALSAGCSGSGAVGGPGAGATGGTTPSPPSSTASGGAAPDGTGGANVSPTDSGSNAGAGANADAASDALVPSDGGSNDATGAARSCSSPTVICDDFEDGALTGWTKSESGGTFTVEGTHAYSGKSSVLLTIPGGRSGGFLVRTGAPLFPLSNNTIWGRMMIYFEGVPSGHFDTIRAAPGGGGTPWYNIGGQNKALMFNYYSGADDCRAPRTPNQTVATGKWMCWEWKYDGSKNEMDLWIDGTLVRQVVGTGDACQGANAPWTAPSFGSIRLGQYNAQTYGSQTRLWMDDIAITTTDRLGCPAVSATAK
ncbi:MAG TPA: hypothetical protein VGL59_14450 [Polyangia bacterium]